MDIYEQTWTKTAPGIYETPDRRWRIERDGRKWWTYLRGELIGPSDPNEYPCRTVMPHESLALAKAWVYEVHARGFDEKDE